MNGVIYCRVSSKEQIEGTSLESQEQACREYARQKHIGVLKIFIEQGESAKFADRTQLLELIEFCRQNKDKAEVLLVWKVDRFSRNVSEHYKIKAELARYGVRVVSVTEPIDTGAEGQLMETILAGFAEFDNSLRARRTVLGMQRKIQDGLFPWRPPLGYKSANDDREKKIQPDLPDQPTFSHLQKAWALLATGQYTKAEIRRLLALWGVTAKKDKPLSAQGIDHLFANPYYAGILINPWTKEEHQGLHAPVVSKEDFARVQRIISGKSRSISHIKHRPEFPLRAFARCPVCLRQLTGSVSKGRTQRYAYYHCANRQCERRGKAIPVRDIHTEFEAHLRGLTPKEGVLPTLAETVTRHIMGRARLARQRAERARATIGSLEKEKSELIRMRAQGLISDNEFMSQRRSLADRHMAIQSENSGDELKPSEVQKCLSEIVAPLANLPETWRSLPMPERRRFEQLILPVGFVAGRIRTAELGLLFRTFRQLAGGNTNAVAPTRLSWNQILADITAFSELWREHQESKTASK